MEIVAAKRIRFFIFPLKNNLFLRGQLRGLILAFCGDGLKKRV